MIDVASLCKRAKTASFALAGYTTAQKNAMLSAIAEALASAET